MPYYYNYPRIQKEGTTFNPRGLKSIDLTGKESCLKIETCQDILNVYQHSDLIILSSVGKSLYELFEKNAIKVLQIAKGFIFELQLQVFSYSKIQRAPRELKLVVICS